MRFQFIAESQHSDCSGHFRLHTQRNPKDQIFAFLYGTGLQNKLLVAIRACGKVAKCRNGVALYLFVVCRAQKVY
jgi:hypothetical protein